MARTKPTPVRRQSSSEFFSRDTTSPTKRVSRNLDKEIEKTNGQVEKVVDALAPAKHAGVKELVFCVGGIYASLYVYDVVISGRIEEGRTPANHYLVLRGRFFKNASPPLHTVTPSPQNFSNSLLS